MHIIFENTYISYFVFSLRPMADSVKAYEDKMRKWILQFVNGTEVKEMEVLDGAGLPRCLGKMT